MLRLSVVCPVLFALSSVSLFGQHAVSPFHRYHRLICLEHLIGAGTESDPRRPEFVPPPNAAPARTGILAWSAQMTDDKQMAIVEYVAVDRGAFRGILADNRPEIRVFEIGKDSRAAIEAFMQRHKANFSLDTMRLPVQ